MTRKTTLQGASKFAMAAFVATGLAASPFALDAGGQLQANNAYAGQAEDYVDGGAGGTTDVHTNVFRILGTTADEAKRETMERTTSTAGPLGSYQDALRDGDLDAAADILAAVSNRPISEALVLDVNNALGVETRLTAERIASVAAERQDPKDLAMVPAIDGSPYKNLSSVDTNSRAFDDYESAMTRGNLDAAADALAEATKQPITEDLVLQVNQELGVESTLTAQQVAQAAASRQMKQ